MRSRKLHCLFATGALLLAAAFLPQANAEFCPPGEDCQLLVHWNFNSEIDGQPPPYPSEETTGPPPTAPFLFNDPAHSFPSGQIVARTGVGTTLNGGGDPAGGALEVNGNTSGLDTEYCFDIGPINVTGLPVISVSFAMQSLGNGGQFDFFSLNWSTDGVNFTNFQPLTAINQDGLYHLYTAGLTLPAGTTSIFIQFCFTGSRNDAVGNHTFIDNIEIDAIIPEPATVTGGLLGVLGLCWQQRRRLIRCVRLRRT
jgi:hypothetical protein